MQRQRYIFLANVDRQNLKHARQQIGATNLKLGRFRLVELHRGLHFLSLVNQHKVKVFLLGDEHPVEHLHETAARHLVAQLVRNRVEHKLAGGSGVLWQTKRYIVVAVRNSHILHNVDGMQNVGACRRCTHRQRNVILALALLRTDLHIQTHAFEQIRHIRRLQRGAQILVDVRCARLKRVQSTVRIKIGRDVGVIGTVINHVHRLHDKRIGAILAEHGDQSIEHNFRFGQIERGTLDEHVFGFARYLAVLAIDDGWQREHYAFRVGNHWEHFRVLNEMKVFFHRANVIATGIAVLFALVPCKQLLGIHLFGFFQRLESNRFWWFSIKIKRRLNRIQIVGTNRHQLTLSTNIKMHFFLQFHQRIIAYIVIQIDIAQHCTDSIISYFATICGIHMKRNQTLFIVKRRQLVVGLRLFLLKDTQSSSQPFHAQEIVSVCRHINLVQVLSVGSLELWYFLLSQFLVFPLFVSQTTAFIVQNHGILGGDLVQFNTKIET
mmetsp:Transcript_33430/g.54404  ORF Transcript_33430/g.54404 Transcript_33430/m.54404 type:complete len:494 (+) Transcript_33430:1237-2718(+)